MKKAILIGFITLGILGVSGCGTQNKETGISTDKIKMFTDAELDSAGNVVILQDNVTETASFVNYNAEGVNIQFIAVKAEDGTVRMALNTCQSCTPSPKAYFVQEGKYFTCQNCGTKFSVNEVGLKKGGCNPVPLVKQSEENGMITITKEELEKYKTNFKNWQGPTE